MKNGTKKQVKPKGCPWTLHWAPFGSLVVALGALADPFGPFRSLEGSPGKSTLSRGDGKEGILVACPPQGKGAKPTRRLITKEQGIRTGAKAQNDQASTPQGHK